MLYGPNTNNGSILAMIESQVDYALRQIDRLASENLAWLDVRPEPMETLQRGDPARDRGREGLAGRLQRLLPHARAGASSRSAALDERVPRAHAESPTPRCTRPPLAVRYARARDRTAPARRATDCAPFRDTSTSVRDTTGSTSGITRRLGYEPGCTASCGTTAAATPAAASPTAVELRCTS
jgi:hypothetical protein